MAALDQDLENFLRQIPFDALAGPVAESCHTSCEEAREFLSLYANETRVALRLVRDHLKPGSRILEVGAGLCLFSLFLKSRGYDITALEPASGGFGKFAASKKVLLDHFGHLDLPIIECPVEQLNAGTAPYALIFSNNVIEHIPNLEPAWRAMVRALTPDGTMLHNCPNYLVPYEPHLGIPVLKWLPGLSAIIFSRTIAPHRELWQSLNFIGYNDVCRLARKSGLMVHFRRGLLFDAFARLEQDALFRERHAAGFAMRVFRCLQWTGLLSSLRHLHPALSTPMIFECRR